MIRVRDKIKGVIGKSDRVSSTNGTPSTAQPRKGADQGPIQSSGFVVGGVADADALRELQRKIGGRQVRTDTLVKIASRDPRFADALNRIADDLENREGATEREQALGKLIRTYLA